MRIIPKKTKVKVEFYRNVSLVDILIGCVGAFIEILLFLSNFAYIKYLLMAFVLGIFICLFLPIDGEKLYMQFGNWIRYLISRKKYEKSAVEAKADISEILPYKAINNGFIEYDGYYGGVLEIQPLFIAL